MTDAMALFTAPQEAPPAPLQSSSEKTPYVAFFHPLNKIAADIIGKLGKVPEGVPILVRPDGSMERLDNMKFWVCPGYLQHFSSIDDSNGILQSKLENPKDYTFGEHVETVCMVSTMKGIEPARITFRSTKCPAAHNIIDEQHAASNGEVWAQNGPDHAAAVAAIAQPWLRVMGGITLENKVAKKPNPKTKQCMPYVQANAMCKPTSGGMYQALVKSAQEHGPAIQSCLDAHNDRITEVRSKVI